MLTELQVLWLARLTKYGEDYGDSTSNGFRAIEASLARDKKSLFWS